MTLAYISTYQWRLQACGQLTYTKFLFFVFALTAEKTKPKGCWVKQFAGDGNCDDLNNYKARSLPHMQAIDHAHNIARGT